MGLGHDGGETHSITIVQLYVPGDPTKIGITTNFAQQYKQLQIAHPDTLPEVIPSFYKDLNVFLIELDISIIFMWVISTRLPPEKHSGLANPA